MLNFFWKKTMQESVWKVISHEYVLVMMKAQESKMILSQSLCLLHLAIPRWICPYWPIRPYLSRSCVGRNLPLFTMCHPRRQLLGVLMDLRLQCGPMEAPHWRVVRLPDQVFSQVLCQLDCCFQGMCSAPCVWAPWYTTPAWYTQVEDL
jgi:hypothetical protein